MMKKTVFLFLVAFGLLLLPLGLAQGADQGGLTMEELSGWVQSVLDRTDGVAPLRDPGESQTEDGYAYSYDFATLYYDSPVLTDDAKLLSIEVTNEEMVPLRGLSVGSLLSDVLEAYANENPGLTGSREQAILYLNNSMPDEAIWGMVFRDGQRIEGIQYTIHDQISSGGTGYTDCGLLYIIEDDAVVAVQAFGLNVALTNEETLAVIGGAEKVARENSYFAYATSYVGTDLQPFNREDLIFSGLDYVGLTPETALAVLGPAQQDERWPDDTGEVFRVMQWPDAEIVFLYTQDETLQGVKIFTIGGDLLEGPRGVRIGDTFSSVMMRFRHGEGTYDGASLDYLYGDGENAPYGLAEYMQGGDALLRYVTALPGEEGTPVTLYMVFMDNLLAEIMIYY